MTLALRTPLAVFATGLLALSVHVGAFAFLIEREVFTSENFVASTVAALGEESSRDAMGKLIVDQLIDEYPLLIILESNLVPMFSDLLGTPALREVIALVGIDIHERIVTGNQDAVAIDLVSYRDTILLPLEAVAPRLADLVPESWFVSVEVLEAGTLPDLSRYVETVGLALFISLAVAVLLIAFLLRFVQRRGVAVALIGVAFMLAAIATSGLVPGGRWLTIAALKGEQNQTIVVNVYNEFTDPLFAGASMLAITGVALIAVGIAMRTGRNSTQQHSPGEG